MRETQSNKQRYIVTLGTAFEILGRLQLRVTSRAATIHRLTHIHNCIIRGLNSILLQGPHVKDGKDFLFYVHSWCKMVDHHHWVEETYIFPELEKLTGISGFMDRDIRQHQEFHDGLDNLKRLQQFCWGDMQQIISTFDSKLLNHLRCELEDLERLQKYDQSELRKICHCTAE